ncbi:hypothetical protein H8711_04785 [Clostridiaceae bacterium NSJ-31]|uniref:Uncharacterized protein n=1 Tax=Ligaoa zhengdingensis TaxID=2763658 RepID=A0A926DYP3_9FIRM|nr:hypothetical protein [Ligaoa zhengdingensis]MBC8546252.1 hypothetical protein [Ligaoa zhengdingensis]
MIIRQLSQQQYDRLVASLMAGAHAEPLDAGYTVRITVNGAEYAVKLQPENRNRMAVVQALRVFRDGGRPNFQLITCGGLLSAFLEILISQGVGDCRGL